MGDQLRRDERRLPRLVAPAVDHLDERPAGALVVDRRPPQAIVHTGQARPRSGTATPAAPRPAAAGPLDGDVSGVPRRAALLLQRLVVLVDDDHRGQVRAGCPRRRPGPDHHVDAAGRRRPLVRHDRHRQPGPPQPDGIQPSAFVRRHHDQRRPVHERGGEDRDDVVGRGKAEHAAAGAQELGGARVDRGDRSRRPARRRQPGDVVRRAGRHQERPQARRSPAHRRPAGQVDQLGRRTTRADLGDRAQGRRRPADRVQFDDPAAHAPAVQRYPHDRADPDLEPLRDRVVERLVQPGDVRQDPDDSLQRLRRGQQP